MKRLLVVLIVVIAETPAWAHSLGAACRLRDGKVEVAAFFSDDSVAADAAVRVTNAEKKVVATGRTDKDGKWSFAAPPKGRYDVVVDAGDGHRVTRSFSIVRDTRLAQANGQPDLPKTPIDSNVPKKLETPGEVSGALLIDEGPTREEFTSFPWLKLSIGLGAILAFGVAFLIAKRAR